MATTYKILAQANPTANAQTTIYTVPASTSAVISTISVCNQSNTTNFRIAAQQANAALSASQYIVYDNFVNQYDTIFLTLGITLGNTDTISVFSGTSNLSFSIFGSEIT
jgi:hypothetical protein